MQKIDSSEDLKNIDKLNTCWTFFESYSKETSNSEHLTPEKVISFQTLEDT